MEIIVGNNITIKEPNDMIKRYCDSVLSITNPDFIIAEKVGRYTGNIEKKINLYVKNGNDYIIPFGCLSSIWKLCDNTKYKTIFSDFKGNNLLGSINLYDYQKTALNQLKRGKNGVLEAPCGSGKTQIGLQLIKELGGRALWLTHTKKLLEQSMDRAKKYFAGDFGTITDGKVNIGNDITFATVQTMRNIEPSIYKDAFDIVIVDECHHCVGSPTKMMQFYKVVSNCNARYKYGLSATLSRADNLINCVYYILGEKLWTITEKDVGDKIIKAEHKLVPINKEYNIFDYCDGDGTLNYNKLINLLSNDKERNKIIIDNVLQNYNLGKKQLILCHRISQVEYLYNKLALFTDACKITGKVKENQREYNNTVIIATYSLAKEGLDLPYLDVLHLATPSKDKALVKQSAGRVERNYEGKKKPLIYDYVDNDIGYCLNCYKKRKNILK